MANDDLHHHPGWPLIFELVRTVDYRFFHCRRCSCCVAFPDTFFEKAENYGLFVAVINFRVDKEKEENRGNVCITTADVHCQQCNNLFGVKVINVTVSDRTKDSREFFWLTMTELMYWNGHEEVEASSIEPPNRSRRQIEEQIEQIYRQKNLPI